MDGFLCFDFDLKLSSYENPNPQISYIEIYPLMCLRGYHLTYCVQSFMGLSFLSSSTYIHVLSFNSQNTILGFSFSQTR